MSLKENARLTLSIVDAGGYDTVSFAEEQAAAVAGTRCLVPDEVAALAASGPGAVPVRITAETTQIAAERMARAGPVSLLNFASARNPGGGFLNGAKAQEEDVCRCSGLYRALETANAYYTANRRQKSLLYTDHMIWSPGVPFFKTRGTGELLAVPFFADVVTAPAPNAGPLLRQDPDAGEAIQACFERRWRNVLCLLRSRGCERVVLGAWGCGAFGNDPEVAASAFRRAWAVAGAGFTEVVFAIPTKGKQSLRNHEVFRDVLSR